MGQKLVYVSNENFFIITIIFFIILIIIIFLYKNIQQWQLNIQSQVIKFLFIFFSLICFFLFYQTIKENYLVMKAFDNKSYKVLEGNINNFIFIPKGEHRLKKESFYVDTVPFIIDYTGNYPNQKTLFYTLTKNKNGPITHNGQMVKIHYLVRDGQNKIIKMWVYESTP